MIAPAYTMRSRWQELGIHQDIMTGDREKTRISQSTLCTGFLLTTTRIALISAMMLNNQNRICVIPIGQLVVVFLFLLIN